jgi:small conductance mechanosensitive channel
MTRSPHHLGLRDHLCLNATTGNGALEAVVRSNGKPTTQGSRAMVTAAWKRAQVGLRAPRAIAFRGVAVALGATLAGLLTVSAIRAQTPTGENAQIQSPGQEETEQPQQRVSVKPNATDPEIAERLTRILISTGWFERPHAEVRDGVVTLDGMTATQEHRHWAGELAAKIEGTVAVVNRIEVEADVRSTFSFAGEELSRLAREATQTWPLVLVAVIIIAIGWLVSRLVGAVAGRLFSPRIESPLLLAVVAKLFAIPVFLLSVYFVLQVAGLTRLALTILGGTGLAGIVIGFAFRDIAENFLSSLLLSIRNPFSRGDLIEVAGHKGVVQNLNTRSTVLLTLDGNHVQIPNATVYKSTITNFSTNASRRAEFTIGIGYDSSTAKAQTLIKGVLDNHPAVLAEPEPLVLVNDLGAATVNLKVRYWFDSATYAPDKTNSALMRISKSMLLQSGIELPDPEREVVFPRGVPVVQMPAPSGNPKASRPPAPTDEEAETVTAAEGALASECPEMERSLEVPEAAEELLKS